MAQTWQSSQGKKKSSKTSPKKGPKKDIKKTAKSKAAPVVLSKKFVLPKNLVLKMYDDMLKSRVIEERLIRIYKLGEAFFWIGGPGEEAFGVPLGHLVNKGQGVEHDWLHMHYRCTPTLIAMGMPLIDPVRLIMNKATDVNTGGRNFAGHYCYPQWNVAPVTSPIEVQYTTAIGTAWVQRRRKAKGITIVTGGDAGTAEGDFASCLVWASRPGFELPMLITVQNNKWGISTSFETQHGEPRISDRGKAFGMRTDSINGNDLEESYFKLQEAMEYIRKTGKPYLMETHVSRLYGHSSASGANFFDAEVDCLKELEQKIIVNSWLKESEVKARRVELDEESRRLTEQVRTEPVPVAGSVWDHVYVNNENADWRRF